MPNLTRSTEIPCFERDGGTMPVLGLGTLQSDGENCRRAVNTALDIGYRHIDTARVRKRGRSRQRHPELERAARPDFSDNEVADGAAGSSRRARVLRP